VTSYVDAARGRSHVTIAALLMGVAVLTSLVDARRFAVVLPIHDAHTVSYLVLPMVFWAAIAACGWYIASLDRMALPQAFASVLLAGFAAHALLLLAASAGRATDRAAYSTTAYWAYARLFCAAVAAIGVAWAGGPGSRAWTSDGYLKLPVVGAVVLFVLALLRADPAAALAGAGLGVVASAPIVRERLRAVPWRDIVTRERAFLALVFLVAVGLRLLYTRRVMTNPDFIETGADAVFYDRIAWSIAQGRGIDNPSFPMYILGYARFVGVMYRIFGHSYFALCAVQSVIGAFVPIGMYYLAKAVAGAGAAGVTALLTATSFPLVFAAAAIGHQAIDVALTLALVGLLAAGVVRPFDRWWQWVGVGIVFGLAIAVRETNAVFLVFALGWLWYALGRDARIAPGAAAALLLVGLVLALAPLVSRMVASPEARLALRAHFDRLYDGRLDPSADYVSRGLPSVATDPAGALEQIRRQPLRFLGTEGRTVARYFSAQFFAQPYGEFDLLLLRKGTDYQQGMLAYAYLFVVVGMIVSCRRIIAGDRWAPVLALLLGLLVFRTLPHLLLDSSYRHRVPIEPYLVLFSQIGFWTVVSRVRGVA